MNKSKSRNRSPNLPEDLNKSKPKSKKSKLSLNTSSEKNKHKARDSNGQSSIISFFQSKVVSTNEFDSVDSDVTIKKKGKNNFNSSGSDSDMEVTENGVRKETKNAFTFMMDNRSKSVGSNSPDREFEECEEGKNSERKQMPQDLLKQKVGKKRKIEDREKGVIVEKKLEQQSKKLKKMLKVRNKPEHVNKEKKKKAMTTHKHRRQKENDEFMLNGKVKWRMRVKINLSEEDTAKLTVSKFNQIKPSKKLDGVEKTDRKIERLKSKTSDEKEVAPIFKVGVQKQRPDGGTIKARIDFLHSEPPEYVRKCIDKHQRVELPNYVVFPTVSHVRIKPTEDQLLLLNPSPKRLVLWTNDLRVPTIGRLTKGCVTLSNKSLLERSTPCAPNKVKYFKKVLEELKIETPQYPVYKVFKFLHGKYFAQPHLKIDNNDLESVQEESKNCESLQMWTDLYKPGTTKLVFGNHSAVSEVKTWLETWVDCNRAMGTRRNSDSSSDFETDGEDSRNKYNAALPRNGLMLVGPHGCGKTMTVYAACNELGINVLEVNASNKRTGKKLLMELQEATRSHQVNKIENSLHEYLQKSNKGMDKMCLLLIEDVDIVFEQDDGFINALCQLLTTSKRPIILTTTDKNCLYLEKFSGGLITFNKLSTKLASPWLQLVCLVEGLLVNRQSIDALLESNNYDMRTTLLQIQLWAQSGGQFYTTVEQVAAKINRDVVVDEVLFQDDNSNISCISEENLSESCNSSQSLYVESFQKLPMLDLDMTWWNLDMPPPNSKTAIKDALNVLETLSAIDTVYKKFDVFDTERRNPTDSLELSQSEEGYSSCRETCFSWSRTLFDGYSDVIKRKPKSLDSCVSSLDRAGTVRRSKCNNSLGELIPLVCHLQHDSISLDYFSTLRTMNRSETARASNNNNKRRRSRFYNYLRGLGLNNGDVNFTTLSSIFNVEDT